MEYASRAVGNAGLTTGIIGTALGALNGAGGLDLLNFGPRAPRDEGNIPVTRHDMGLYRKFLTAISRSLLLSPTSIPTSASEKHQTS